MIYNFSFVLLYVILGHVHFLDIATCRKNFSQWESSFLWKLQCHWLKFLRRVAKTLVIQGPDVFVNRRCIFIFMDIYADTKSIGHSMIYFNLIDTSTKHMKRARVYCTHIDRLLVMLAFNDIQHVSGIYPAIGLYVTCHFRNETERIRI